MKEQDLFLNVLANPQFSIADFATLGYTPENTTMASESDYMKNDLVQNSFTKDDGSFDKDGFHNAYLLTLAVYNMMENDRLNQYFQQQYDYHRDNIFAPKNVERDKAKQDASRQIILFSNPFRQTRSLVRVGLTGRQKYSEDEIAQTQKVWDPKTKTWHASPNESWFTDFWDTRVMAQYDENEDAYGNVIEDPNDPRIVHRKGELKLNENGTYYYENLNGRSIYGRRVLNKLNTLTTDGSRLNKYDFFDSDDIDQKSLTGTVMKNAALIGSMFIPYVGPWIAGASALTQITNLGAVLGKMITGSDSPTLSAIEGWTQSVNRLTLKSKYAQENTWCWENMIDVTADLMGQLRELRFLFEYVPMLIKGNRMKGFNWGFNEAKLNSWKAALTEELMKINLKKVGDAIKEGNLLRASSISNNLKYISASGALLTVNKYLKDYQKIGEVLSKVYMAGLISSQLYGEMKLNGVSDADAAIFTLGRFAAEMALLATPMGDFILPELRAQKLQAKGIVNALAKDAEGNANKLFNTIRDKSAKVAENASKADKVAWYKQLYNWAVQLPDKGAEVLTSTTAKQTWLASLSNGIEVGTVNDIEEFFNDMAKQLYNIKLDISGGEVRMNPWENPVDRYGMGMVSGLVGGTLTSAWTNYGTSKAAGKITNTQALQELIWLDRNNQMKDFYSSLENIELAPTNLSWRTPIDSDGVVFEAAKNYEDSQDYAIKKMIRDTIDDIHNIMTSEGCTISDDSFLKGQLDLLGEMRFALIANSQAAAKRLLEFNSVCADIVRLNLELKEASGENAKTDREALHDKQEKENNPKLAKEKNKDIKKIADLLREKIQYKDDLIQGKYTQSFVEEALVELTPMLSEYMKVPSSFVTFAEMIDKKPFAQIPDSRKKELDIQYRKWVNGEKKDFIGLATQLLHNTIENASNVVSLHALEYDALKNDPIILKLNSFFSLSDDLTVKNLLRQKKISLDDELYQAAYMKEMNGLIIGRMPRLLTVLNDEVLQNSDKVVDAFKVFEEKKLLLKEIAKNETISINDNGVLDQDAKAEQIQQINDNLNSEIATIDEQEKLYIGQKTASVLGEILSNYEKLGFMNHEAKLAFGNAIDRVLNFYEKNDGTNMFDPVGYLRTLNMRAQLANEDAEIAQSTGNLEKATLLTLEEKQLRDLHKLLKAEVKQLKEYKKLIERLPYTPIEELLNQFSLATTGKPAKISDLLKSIQNVLDSRTAYSFLLGNDLLQQLNDILSVINMYSASLEAMKTDNLNEINLFGFTHTLNELANKNKAEGWVPLAEINSEAANTYLIDLNILRNKIESIKALYEMNRGQKITQANRIGLNKDYIFFERAQKLLKSIEKLGGWKSIDELENATNHATTLKNHVEEKTQGLSPEESKQIKKERIDIENAIYSFFEKNDILNMSAEKLATLLTPEIFDMYSKPETMLTENTKAIDDNSFIWYLASRAAVKADGFYNEYSQVIEISGENIIAPLPSLEMAIYNNYASVVNGDVFSKFVEAYQIGLKNHWKKISKDERLQILDRLKYDKKFAEDKYAETILSIIPAPTFKNIVLTEGIPGSGKTAAVYDVTLKMLMKFHPDAKLFDNVAVIHGANKSSAESFIADRGLQHAHAYTTAEFMLEIVANYRGLTNKSGNSYELPDGLMGYTKNGEIKCTSKVTKTDKPYTLIIIDETTNITMPDLDMIDYYAQHYGISVLSAGDMDQSGVNGSFKMKSGPLANEKLDAAMTRINFPRSAKLGNSLRTANCWKSENTNVLQQVALKNLYSKDQPIELKYHQDTTGLFGDKVYNLEDNDMFDEAMDEKYGELKKDVDLLFASKKQGTKIGYITNGQETPLYKYIKSKYAEDIIEYKGTSALGAEGLYYIVEGNQTSTNFLRDLYTGVTRSEQGSLIVNSIYGLGAEDFVAFLEIDLVSNAMSYHTDEGMDRLSVINLAKREKAEYAELTKDAKPIKFIKRTQVKRNGTPTQESTGEPITEPKIPTPVVDSPNTESSQPKTEPVVEAPKTTKTVEKSETTEESETAEIVKNDDESSLPKEVIKDSKVIVNFDENSVELLLMLPKPTEIPKNYRNLLKSPDKPIYALIVYNDGKGSNVVTFVQEPVNKPDDAYYSEEFEQIKNIPQKDILLLTLGKIQQITKTPAIDDVETAELSESENQIKSTVSELNNFDVTPIINDPTLFDFFAKGYSWNVNETGVKVDEDGFPEYFSNNPVVQRQRIDSVNGLMKLTMQYGNSDGVFQYYHIDTYSKILAELKDVFYSTGAEYVDTAEMSAIARANSDIVDGVKRVLRKWFNIPADEISFNYGFKGMVNPERVKNKEQAQYGPFEHNAGEKVRFLYATDDRQEQIMDKKIIVRISDGNRDILELPLLALPNPFSIINELKDGEFLYPDVLATWNSIKNNNPDANIYECIQLLLTAYNDSNLYQGLMLLFKLWTVTSNIITKFSDDFVFAKEFLSLGPDLVTSDRGYEYEETGFRLTLDGSTARFDGIEISGDDYVNLDEFAKNPGIFISDVLKATQSQIVGTNGELIMNEYGETDLIRQGHNLILYSYNSQYLSTDDMISRYIYELQNPNAPKYIRLAYVIPPSATIGEYIQSLHEVITEGRSTSIGNSFDVYNIMNILINSEDFRNNVKLFNNDKDDIFTKIEELLEPIRQIENLDVESDNLTQREFIRAQYRANKAYWDKQKVELDRIKTFKSGRLNIESTAVNKILKNLLKQFVYRYDYQDKSYSLVLDNLDLITRILSENGIDNIRYFTRIPKTSSQYGSAIEVMLENGDSYVSPFYRIELTNGMIEGIDGENKSFKVSAVLNSNTYKINVGKISKIILNLLGDWDGQKRTPFNKMSLDYRATMWQSDKHTYNSYMSNKFVGRNDSYVDPVDEIRNKLKSIGEKIPNYAKELWDSTILNKLFKVEKEFIKEFISEFNKTKGVAFLSNNTIFLTDAIPFTKNQLLRNSEMTLDGEVRFEIYNGDLLLYTVTLDKNDSSIADVKDHLANTTKPILADIITTITNENVDEYRGIVLSRISERLAPNARATVASAVDAILLARAINSIKNEFGDVNKLEKLLRKPDSEGEYLEDYQIKEILDLINLNISEDEKTEVCDLPGFKIKFDII